jgi:hypothetical protein
MTDRFRHRSPEIEAVQWTGSNADILTAFAPDRFATAAPEDRIDPEDDAVVLIEESHWVAIRPGCWVLKHPDHFDVESDADFRAGWAVTSPDRQTAVLRDFLWRLEQSAGDAATEKFLDDNPELQRLAAAAAVPAGQAPATGRATPRCVCGDPIEWYTAPGGGAGWVHRPVSDVPILDVHKPRPADETQPATDQTTLRESIAETLALRANGSASDGRGWYRSEEQRQALLTDADAVLAMLPASVDRADVLRWAADELDSISAQFDVDSCDCGNCTLCAWKDAARHLRRAAVGASAAAEPADETTTGHLATCTATIGNEDDPDTPVRCTAPAGHYDEAQEPVTGPDRNPGGWHTDGRGRMWTDRAATATPHTKQPAAAQQPKDA